MRYGWIALPAVVVFMAAQPAQPPWKADNLQYFPKDVTRPVLIQRMREFSFALGVRCQYCHSGGNGISFDGVVFSADDKPAKVKARAMLRMVDDINSSLLAKLPSRAEPRVVVTCATCHHGLALPKSLQTTLMEVIEKDGIAAAVAKYRQLRTDNIYTGSYNFGQWEMNELGRRLTEAGKTDGAIAMLELNREFYPKSAEIEFALGELHLGRGERDLALQSYRAALVKDPENQGAKRRIEELEKK
jgi:photosynthetic reaction center cytochrome c subunit